jgi:hypothetical protein
MLFIDGYIAKLDLWILQADEQTNREHYLIRTRNSTVDEGYFYYLIQAWYLYQEHNAHKGSYVKLKKNVLKLPSKQNGV